MEYPTWFRHAFYRVAGFYNGFVPEDDRFDGFKSRKETSSSKDYKYILEKLTLTYTYIPMWDNYGHTFFKMCFAGLDNMIERAWILHFIILSRSIASDVDLQCDNSMLESDNGSH